MKRATLACLLLAWVSVLAASERVIRISDESKSLDERWTEAFQSKDALKRSCWIGYVIDVMMDENNHIHCGDNNTDDPTLEELISGKTVSRETSVREAARMALEGRETESGRTINKRIGILFAFGLSGRSVRDFTEIIVTDFDSRPDLDGRPLVWMGAVGQSESLPYLVDIYKDTKKTDQKEDLVSVIAFHKQQKETVPFLKEVVRSREGDEVRKKAVFWLSMQDGDVLDFLVDVAKTDRSGEVREHAVFAVSQVHGKEAEEALIVLARNAGDSEIRKKAVFWLGQKASEKATRLLKDVAEDDPDTEVKEHAVFALSQMHTTGSSKILMEIAKTNPSREVRKKAIFWLGQSDDPEAVDFLIALVREAE